MYSSLKQNGAVEPFHTANYESRAAEQVALEPSEVTKHGIERTIQAFKDGASRAKHAGFDIIELHSAHGI